MRAVKKLFESLSEIGMNPVDGLSIESGIKSLISQSFPIKQGLEFKGLEIDQEDGCIWVELLADSEFVLLCFYMADDMPILAVSYDGDDEPDDEYDLSGLEPYVVSGLVDVSAIDKWMPVDLFMNIVYNQWTSEENEELSLDNFEQQNVTFESFATGEADSKDIRDDHKKKKEHRQFSVNRVVSGGWGGFFPFIIGKADNEEQEETGEENEPQETSTVAPAAPAAAV